MIKVIVLATLSRDPSSGSKPLVPKNGGKLMVTPNVYIGNTILSERRKSSYPSISYKFNTISKQISIKLIGCLAIYLSPCLLR